ncbi:Nudix hydrolase domain-containing protein [Mycena kentingensis (nom. inval.)]|nr:Nudix hydrolase domain-containing protein [Mycena kentingensis (nom. inval.)]
MAFFKTPAPADLTKPMSRWSDAPIPTCNFADQNMLLGAGMVIFQEETDKIVVCYEQKKHYWFFPKGRKDIGESLEQTALREAYEEVRSASRSLSYAH